jgi:actin-related protein
LDATTTTTNATTDTTTSNSTPLKTSTSHNRVLSIDHPYQGGRIVNDTIDSIRYDYYTRPIHYNTDDDGDYEPCNPVDMKGTGLFYQSLNSNAITSHINQQQQQQQPSPNTNRNDVDTNIVPDWYDMIPYFMNHVYETSSFMGQKSSDSPLLFIEKSYNTSAIRQKIVECLFEECHVPSAFLAKDAVLQCYGVGKTTSISIDIGYSGITVSPVYDGFVEKGAIQRNPVGIKALDDYILQYMDRIYAHQYYNTNRHKSKSNQKDHKSLYCMPLYQVRQKDRTKLRKESIHYWTRLELAQHCRESGNGATILENATTTTNSSTTNPSSSAQPSSSTTNTTNNSNNNNTSKSSTTTFHAPNTSFELPDGTVLEIPSSDRFHSADVLLGNNLSAQIMKSSSSASSSMSIQQYRENIYQQTKQHVMSYKTLILHFKTIKTTIIIV